MSAVDLNELFADFRNIEGPAPLPHYQQAPVADTPQLVYEARISKEDFEFFRQVIDDGLEKNPREEFYLVSDVAELQQQLLALKGLIRNAYLEWQKVRPPVDFDELALAVWDELVGISVLGPLWRDTSITEIMVDGGSRVLVERDGRLEQVNVRFADDKHAQTVAQNLARAVANREVSPAVPLVSAALPDARIGIAYGHVVSATGGVAIAIRRFGNQLSAADLQERGAVHPELMEFLATCVKARANILVSGGTGSGKTTLLNALSEFIPPDERIITVEDTYELNLRAPFVVSMQAKEAASADDEITITIADLLKQCLRMRPDRIIVGEVRDGAAATTLLEAANTGHDGTMTTIHANSAQEAINTRLTSLYLTTHGNVPQRAALATISSAFDIVVSVKRRRSKRFVHEVLLVKPLDLTSDVSRIETVPLARATFKPGSDDLEWELNLDADRIEGSLLHEKILEVGLSI